MDGVGGCLGSGSAGGEVAVAERAQRLPEPLAGRVEAVVGEHPGVHRPPRRTGAPSSASSPRSATTTSAPRSARAVAWPPRSTPTTSREPAAPPRLHPGQGVLDHRGPVRRHPQPPGGLQEQRRVGLAGQPQALGLDPVDLDIEQLAQPGRLQHGDHVAAGRHRRGPQPALPQPADERDRCGEGLGAVVAEVGDEEAVLGVAEPADRLAVRWVARVTPGQRDVPGGKEAGDAVVARPAVDVAQVVGLGESPERLTQAGRPLRQVLVEQPFPGGRVHAGGVGEHAVGVEHDRFQAVQREGGPAGLGHARILSPGHRFQGSAFTVRTRTWRALATLGVGGIRPPGAHAGSAATAPAPPCRRRGQEGRRGVAGPPVASQGPGNRKEVAWRGVPRSMVSLANQRSRTTTSAPTANRA